VPNLTYCNIHICDEDGGKGNYSQGFFIYIGTSPLNDSLWFDGHPKKWMQGTGTISTGKWYHYIAIIPWGDRWRILFSLFAYFERKDKNGTFLLFTILPIHKVNQKNSTCLGKVTISSCHIHLPNDLHTIVSANIGSYDDSHYNYINFRLENWSRCSGCRSRTRYSPSQHNKKKCAIKPCAILIIKFFDVQIVLYLLPTRQGAIQCVSYI